jgi:NAD(P)-dependent dehydrogenase (short-subunit alcohol dehydrogenase family)
MSQSLYPARIAVVTGANKGIGLEVRLLRLGHEPMATRHVFYAWEREEGTF